MAYAGYVISTPCAFTHDYESERFSIAQIPNNVGDYRHYRVGGPFEHHFYVVTIGNPDKEKGPAFCTWKDQLSAALGILSVWYGKHIRSHGALLLGGSWCLPDMLDILPNDYYFLPFYRVDQPKAPSRPCNWQSIHQLARLLAQCVVESHQETPLVQAARIYSDALKVLPVDIELAYVRLIQCLEKAASTETFSESEMYAHDEQLMAALSWLAEQKDPEATKVAKLVRSRLYQISRGVWLWLSVRIDDAFFVNEVGALNPDTLEKGVKAAYALRSRYVHAGLRFGDWIDPTDGRCRLQEMVPKTHSDICKDRELRKLLERCPTVMGLERLVRYALIREIENEIIPT